MPAGGAAQGTPGYRGYTINNKQTINKQMLISEGPESSQDSRLARVTLSSDDGAPQRQAPSESDRS